MTETIKKPTQRKKTRKDNPPSRTRYEEKNPVVCFRVPIKLKVEFQEYLEKRKITGSQFFKEVLEKKEADLFDLIEETELRGFNLGCEIGEEDGRKEGYNKGYQEALNIVVISCSKCEKALKIDLKSIPEARQLVVEALRLWCHGECLK